MKNKTLLLLIIVSLCLLLMAGVGGVFAYFTTQNTATNVITAGNFAIALHEFAKVEGEDELQPFENLSGVVPGAHASKIVWVENTGNSPAWIRIKAEVAFIAPTTKQATVKSKADPSLVSFTGLNTTTWTERDGYYYHLTALEAGEKTEPLFTGVAFSSEIDNHYARYEAEVTVRVEAVQTVHNGETVFDALGWQN